jgi:hypothetical protein
MNATTSRNAAITIIARTTILFQLVLSSIDFSTLSLGRVYAETQSGLSCKTLASDSRSTPV